MKLDIFKPYAKYGLFLVFIISLVGTAYADANIHTMKELNKPGGIALSWDDSAHIDSCYQYLSMFQKYNATCTMNVNNVNNRPQYVINELNALHLAGWEIASHGYDHVNSVQFTNTNAPETWLKQEIFPSIVEVSLYNHPVKTFVYPYSARNVNTDAILAPYFRTLRTRAPDIINGNVNETPLAYYKWNNAQLLYGVEIDDMSGASLQSIEYGIDHAIKTGTVLVLYGHYITPNVTIPYETSTSRLDSILNYTKQNGGVFYRLGDLGNSSWVQTPKFTNITANFISNVTSGIAPLNVSFTDTSTGTLNSWNWDFGDGTNSTEQNPKHTYFLARNYIARLTVSGANDTDSKVSYNNCFRTTCTSTSCCELQQ